MSIKDAILAALAEEQEGQIKGRTVLQKKLYFASVLSGEDFGYSPHYYGPYSSVVANELDALKEASLVVEGVDLLGVEGQFGELRRYSYRLSQPSNDVLKAREKQIEKYRSAARRINAHPLASNPDLLSVAAKVHYIAAEQQRASVASIRQRAESLGWNIDPTQIDQVVVFLQQLDLVETR